MTLKQIAIRNLLRRKAKAGFILAGLAIGIATIVAVISFTDAMTGDINHKLEKYGANILIVPRAENLTLSYGGISLGGVSFEMSEPTSGPRPARNRRLGGLRRTPRTSLEFG